MKTAFRLLLAALVLIGTASQMNAQSPAVTHNTWTSGAAMPTARFGAFAGAIGKNIYVIGGATNSGYGTTSVNEIYNTKKNTWTTGASDPTTRWSGASAVVNGILYLIGGQNGVGGSLNLVEAYDPASDTWTTLASMPTARSAMPAVVDKDIIYVIGGYVDGANEWLATVESYNTTTDPWTEETPLLEAKSWLTAGLLVATVVAADGQISGNGGAGTPVGDNEGYNAKTKSWTTLASMPDAVLVPSSATVGGRLYCIGGSDVGLANIFDYVQIYQP